MNKGDIVIPKTVFNYELGKYKTWSFKPDNEIYKMLSRPDITPHVPGTSITERLSKLTGKTLGGNS